MTLAGRTAMAAALAGHLVLASPDGGRVAPVAARAAPGGQAHDGRRRLSLGWIWPRAISRLYEEPKKLVAAGLANSRQEATGRRRSTVYSITAAGREALAAWLAEPGAGPLLECEALVKIAYADQGTRDGLLANLAALIDDTTAKLHFGEMIATQYLEGRGPFQQRLPLSGLMWRFLWEYNATVLRWARWARGEVEAWPDDLSELDVTAEFSRIVSAASRPWPNPDD